MKRYIITTLTLTLISAFVFAQKGTMFEFKITSDKGDGGAIKTYYSTSGTRMEMKINIPQMPGGGIVRTNITKSAKPTTVYSLDDKTKTYTTTETANSPEATCDKCVVKVMGKEKVGNYNCTHVVITKGAETSIYWTTNEIPEFEKYAKSNMGNKYMGTSGDYALLAKNNAAGFVVKSVTKDARSSVFTMELVRTEKQDMPANMFEVPTDYKPATGNVTPGKPTIDMNKIQNMTPEERQKYIEDVKKQAGSSGGGK